MAGSHPPKLSGLSLSFFLWVGQLVPLIVSSGLAHVGAFIRRLSGLKVQDSLLHLLRILDFPPPSYSSSSAKPVLLCSEVRGFRALFQKRECSAMKSSPRISHSIISATSCFFPNKSREQSGYNRWENRSISR